MPYSGSAAGGMHIVGSSSVDDALRLLKRSRAIAERALGRPERAAKRKKRGFLSFLSSGDATPHSSVNGIELGMSMEHMTEKQHYVRDYSSINSRVETRMSRVGENAPFYIDYCNEQTMHCAILGRVIADIVLLLGHMLH